MSLVYRPYNILPHRERNVKFLGAVVNSVVWCFVTQCDVVCVCKCLINNKCYKVTMLQRYMSGFVKGFLARRHPLTLFNKKLIYILKKTSHCNIALLSTTYRRFACNIRVTFVTLLCYQWLRRVELLSLLVSEVSGSCPKYNLVTSYG